MVFVVALEERKLGLSFHGPAGRRGRLGNLNTRFRSTRAHTYPLRCCSLLYGAIKSINIGSRLMVVTHVKACSEAAQRLIIVKERDFTRAAPRPQLNLRRFFQNQCLDSQHLCFCPQLSGLMKRDLAPALKKFFLLRDSLDFVRHPSVDYL